jgi:hypothetical protein
MSPGRSVPWTIHPLDDPSPGRTVPWTNRPRDKASPWGRTISPRFSHKMDETSLIFWGRFVHLASASPTLRHAHRSPKRACIHYNADLQHFRCRRHIQAAGVGTAQPGAAGAGTARPGATRYRTGPARSHPAPGPQLPSPKSMLNRRVLHRWSWGCFVTKNFI